MDIDKGSEEGEVMTEHRGKKRKGRRRKKRKQIRAGCGLFVIQESAVAVD